MHTGSIGVIDSGLGGVSTLRQLIARFPAENFRYFGDCGNAPYGSRSEKDIRTLALSACTRMEASGAKALVIACNTSVAVALPALTRALSIPVVGIRPAIQRAAALPGNGRILMLATEATAKSPGYLALHAALPTPSRVVNVGCPADIVRNVELGVLEPEAYFPLLDRVLLPYDGACFDAIVLGCTHYPFAGDAISAYAAKHFTGNCTLVEGGKEVCDALADAIAENDLQNPDGTGRIDFTCSGDAAMQRETFQRLLHCKLPDC